MKAKSTWRGMPVPYPLKWKDERPLFTELDPVLVQECINRGLCGICGYILSPRNAIWIGGQRHVADSEEWIGDLPMHHVCADYAVNACPFLRGEQRATDDYPLWLICGSGIQVNSHNETRPQHVKWQKKIRDKATGEDSRHR